jgi:hypothetical protein
MKKNYPLLLQALLWHSLLIVSLTASILAALAAHSPSAQADNRLPLPTNAIDAPVGSSDTGWDDPSPPPDLSDAPTSAPSTPTSPIASDLLQTVKAESAQKPIELEFDPSKSRTIAQPAPKAIASPVSNSGTNQASSLDSLFAGDSDSLVAKAVGSAEGTRTPDGDRNPAYYGHVDPGNKAWNLGSFSYQHGAASPEEADRKQLQRLQDQAAVLQATAIADGVNLTLEETLNGIDLANQAPKAALDRQGYIDWLAKAHAIGKTGEDAILWARAQSYFDPATQRWNAPGLGNTEASITHDQARRMAAISQTLEQSGIDRLFQEKPLSPFASSPKIEMKQSARLDHSSHESEVASIGLLFSTDLVRS